jgi:hypothetical protein
MKFRNKIVEYLLVTILMTTFYYPALIPLLIVFGLSWDKIGEYLLTGFGIDLLIAYPLAKILIKIFPIIQKLAGTYIEPVPINKYWLLELV